MPLPSPYTGEYENHAEISRENDWERRRSSSSSSRTAIEPSTPTCPSPSEPPSASKDPSAEDEPDPELAEAAKAHASGHPPPQADIEKGATTTEDKPDETPDRFEVGWESDHDARNPKNWGRGYRWVLTAFSGLLLLNATFASSAPSGEITALSSSLSLSQETGTLIISLFVAGYCIGPLLFGPLSEQIGRRPVFLIGFVGYTGMSAACALVRDEAGILVCRFLAGGFASAPLTNTGAILGDIWDPETRGVAMGFFVVAPFAGPCLGPAVAGFMQDAGLSWRWLFWLLTCFAGLLLILIVFFLPETYSPVLLTSIAEAKRLKTGDGRWYAPLEREREEMGWRERLGVILGRPFRILLSEPMHAAMTVYMAFIYGCIYLLFEAYPLVFTTLHHLSAGLTGLTFLPVFLGAVLAVLLHITIFDPRYRRLARACAPRPPPPEMRLEMALWGGSVFALGFFWFGWTSGVGVWAPMMAGVFLGAGIIMIYLPLLNYILDAYLLVAASALASNTVGRSAVGAGFPLFATQMFEKLGPPWASTLLGAVAVLMVPIPWVLKRWGRKGRRRSRWAPVLDEE